MGDRGTIFKPRMNTFTVRSTFSVILRRRRQSSAILLPFRGESLKACLVISEFKGVFFVQIGQY